MDHVTPEQFAESVRSAIGSVNQFYGQIDRLNSLLKAALTSGQDRFTVLGGIPPQPGKRKDARVIRYDYGYLYHADATEGDEDDEDALDEDLDADEDKPPRAPKHTIEIFPDQPVLAVRTVLFDPVRPQELEPHILYVGMTDWGCGSKKTTPKAGQPFRLKRYMVSRVLRAFDHRTDLGSGQRLSTKAIAMGGRNSGPSKPDSQLNCQLLSSVQSVKLYDLDGSGAIEQLAADPGLLAETHDRN
ncbi:MAG: hypothetical protein IIA33_05145 [Planctomycetes bacterium]|nr:hypothetical protein [Planctomycetota bacterium]